MVDPSDVEDAKEAQRFELHVGALTAFIQYQPMHGLIVLTHTEVPDELEGMGMGSVLAQGALDALKARSAEVLPICPFVHEYIRRHPQYLDLVSGRYKLRDELES